jgi:hypothetical protein
MGCANVPHAAVAWSVTVDATTRNLSRRSRRIGVVAALLFAAGAVLTVDAASAATPDFSGTWDRYPDPWEAGPIPDDPPPPGGEPNLKQPYASAYEKLKQSKAEGMKTGKAVQEPSTLCRNEGMPTIMGAVHPIEILQTPKQLVVLAEFLTQTRRVYLNEKMPALEDISPGYNGYSVGRWEGDTLVIQTIGVREDVQFMGFPHSAQMKITERLRFTAKDLVENQITIEDPDVLAKPYKFTFGYKRISDYRIMEYICDNNRYHPNAEGGVDLDVSSK